MRYAQAVKACYEANKLVRRPTFGTQYITTERNGLGVLVLYKRTPGFNTRHRYFATRADTEATDWEIIE